MKRWIKQRSWLAAGVALGAAALIAGCGGTSSSSSGASGGAGGGSSVLTVESSQQNAITQNFNPFIQSSAATLLGATSLMYEPLLQTNAIKPGQYYNWLATGYSWSNGGKSITFTIRPGVKWSNGTPMTAADVAFTFNMIKQYPDVNNTGLAVASVSSTGNQVTLNFSSPQYANLQNIAGQTYIVPASIWSKVGDPGKYTDPNPVGTGPYTVSQFSPQGVTLKANPSYWGGEAGGVRGAVPDLRVGQHRAGGPPDRSAALGGQLHPGRAAGVRLGPLRPPGVVPAGADQQPRAEPDQVPDEPARGAQGDQPGDRPDRAEPAGRRRTRAAGVQRQRADAADLPAVPVAIGGEP